MRKKRMDSRGQELFCGEYEREDGRYAYHYKCRDGKQRWIYAQRLSELRTKEAKIAYMEYLNISKQISDITLNDQFEIWFSTKQTLRVNTRALYRLLYDSYIRNSLGKELIDQISTFQIKCHYNSLIINQRLTSETVEHVQNILYQVFQSALEREVIIKNPAFQACRELRREHSKHTSTRVGMSKKEADTFLEFVRCSNECKRWYPLIYMFINTGLRIGEMSGLRWEDVNEEEGIINVDHELISCRTDEGKSVFHVFPPKTEAGFRKLPLSPKMIEILELERSYQKYEGTKCNETIDGYTGFIFLNRFGGHISQAPVNRALKRIQLRYGKNTICDEKGESIILPHITTHTFRHTFANILCENNVNIKVMQYLLGHSDIATTMDIYTHAHERMVIAEYCRKVRQEE